MLIIKNRFYYEHKDRMKERIFIKPFHMEIIGFILEFLKFMLKQCKHSQQTRGGLWRKV
jgi:hypothetical protein